jgi:hypothetical protein
MTIKNKFIDIISEWGWYWLDRGLLDFFWVGVCPIQKICINVSIWKKKPHTYISEDKPGQQEFSRELHILWTCTLMNIYIMDDVWWNHDIITVPRYFSVLWWQIRLKILKFRDSVSTFLATIDAGHYVLGSLVVMMMMTEFRIMMIEFNWCA